MAAARVEHVQRPLQPHRLADPVAGEVVGVAQWLSWQGRLNVLIALVVGMVVLAWWPFRRAMLFELALGVLALIWLAVLKKLLKRQLQAIPRSSRTNHLGRPPPQ